MHVLVVGGTGFIGYHVVHQLLSEGKTVSLLSRNPAKASETFDGKVNCHKGDLNFFRSINFDTLFKGVDTVVYAAGIDEREVPVGDPYQFFYKENVTTCVELLEKAKAHGVKHVLITGSMFSYLNDQYPDMQLAEHHSYIRSRCDQKREALALANDGFQVNIIEIPYVFGKTPEQGTIWKSLYNYVRVASPLIVTPGGANVMSVYTLAKAIAGVINHVDESGSFPVGDRNMTWAEILESISLTVNKRNKNITLLKSGLFSDLTRMGAFFQEFIGHKSGLDHRKINEIILLEAFIDCDDIKQKLDYIGGDLDLAFSDTAKACPQNAIIDNLQKSVDWISDSAESWRDRFDKKN